MKLLIVDDAFNSRRVIRKFVSEEFPEIRFLSDASNVEEAVIVINEERPEILLLDIQLNKETTFDILSRIDSTGMEILFITAYDHFALKAFDVGASSYLLKPIDKGKLVFALSGAIERLKLRKESKQLDSVNSKVAVQKVIIPGGEMSRVVEVDRIRFIKAEGVYCEVHFTDGKKELVSKPLIFMEEKLEGNNCFVRVHKSYLINIEQIEMISSDTSSLSLKGGEFVPVARSKKALLKSVFNHFFG